MESTVCGIINGEAQVLRTPAPPLTARYLVGGTRAMPQYKPYNRGSINTPIACSSSAKRFCSQACASRRHPRVEKVCVVCDKPFTVDYGNRHQQACSPDCGFELRRVKTVARHAAKRALEGRVA